MGDRKHTPTKVKDVFDRFKPDPEHEALATGVIRQLVGLDPINTPPPEDTPALEKINIYARAGFISRYAGTPEAFEQIWEEAFKKKGRYSDLAEALKEKRGEK